MRHVRETKLVFKGHWIRVERAISGEARGVRKGAIDEEIRTER